MILLIQFIMNLVFLKKCLDMVNDIIEIIIGLNNNGIVKITILEHLDLRKK